MSLSAHAFRPAATYGGAMSGVSVLLVAALLITRAATAQVFQTLTPTPPVTGATAAWQLRGDPVFHSGAFYNAAGPAVSFDGNVMQQSGVYEGVPLYVDVTSAPDVVFVPIGGNLMRPYERSREHDLTEMVPAGTRLVVRLEAFVSSARSTLGDRIPAVLIQSGGPGGSVLIPGTGLLGTVQDAERGTRRDGRAVLQLNFDAIELAGTEESMRTRVLEVDNARESVDAAGIIHGLKPLSTKPSKAEDVLLLAAHAHPVLLASLEAVKFILARAQRPQVEYAAGTELVLELEEPLAWHPGPARPGLGPEIPPDDRLNRLIARQPLRATTRNLTPSDPINVLLVGTAAQVSLAFREGGWQTAVAHSIRSDTETLLAVADRHSYRQGPVSPLLIDGRRPDLVFQRQLDTFAKRHHIRLWRTADSWDGTPVWVGAATHDIGIYFSSASWTFTHRIDRRIDLEREKITADLRFTGRIQSLSYVERSAAPSGLSNASGEPLITDGRIAVMVLR
jgi:hypothetical protein